MSPYAFRAVDRQGTRVSGYETAANAAAATVALEARGLVVLEMAESGEQGAGGFGFGGIRQREVLELTRSLAALLPAGLPLARALATTASLVDGRAAEVVRDVQQQVERGEGLAQSLECHRAIFGSLYIGLVRAGERSGNLAGAFQRLADQMEHDAALKARLISASIYPLILGVAGGVAVTILLVAVIPRFVDLLEGTGATLPRSTALLLTISDTLRTNWLILPLGAIALGALAVWIRSTDEGRRAWSRLTLALPLIGSLRREALAARFARLLSVLLGGGAPLLTGLDDTIESLDDPLARDEAVRVRSQVREGVSLQAALSQGRLFPDLLSRLVAVGDESGRLREFLDKGADMLEERTERLLGRLVALAEPVMIVVFGGMVGFVALALLQAIYGVNGGVR